MTEEDSWRSSPSWFS